MSTRLNFALQRLDTERRTVFGIITSESPDRAGEILDYATSREYFERWSAGIHKTTGGKSLGSVREMHRESAVGKLTSVVFNDELKQIEVEAKVVDDDAWQKCLEGVYSAFSIGGHYIKKWRDAATNLVRYTCEPREVSLVDFPALPGATFEIRKSDGAVETRAFASTMPGPTEAEPALEKRLELARRAVENLEKAHTEIADKAHQNTALLHQISDIVEAIAKGSPQYLARIAKCGRVDDEPMPPRAATRAVAKDAATVAAEEADRLASLTEEEKTIEMLKEALRQPINLRKTIKDKD